MADDISKKITIEVEAETDKLKQNVTELNQTLDGLLLKQKQLTDSGQQSTKAFSDIATQVKATQTALDNYKKAVDGHTTAINDNAKALNTSKGSLVQNKEALQGLLEKYDAISRAQGDNSKSAKALNQQIGTLSNAIKTQEKKVEESRKVFDVHTSTNNALKSSFDKLKNVPGDFGPSLKEAAEGFESLKTGLSAVKTGFTSVGEAIKTTGFGLLVLVLQSLVDYFTKTKEGSAKLRGAISAVGKVIEIIHQAFAAFGKIMVDAVSHPVQSIKALGNLIRDNIVNRFKAFSVILDGIIHLDFKKVANGAIQAFTGVTDATDKIGSAFTAVKNGIIDTAGKMVSAYNDGYNKAGKKVDEHETKVKQSLERQGEEYDKLGRRISKTYDAQANKAQNQPDKDGDTITAVGSSGKDVAITGVTENSLPDQTVAQSQALKDAQEKAALELKIQQEKIQKVEDFAKQSAVKVATDALSTLTKSIEQQSAAKIAALEKDKSAELSNSSLTSAQKLAIQNKYKQQEGAIKAKAFKEEQEASIAQAVINGAIAVTKVSAQTGVLAALEIGAVVAETAIQVAKISTQKPPAYAKGGLHYQSDGRGGMLPGYSKTDNMNAYLRSGEGIVVSEAMQVPWARNLVSAINVGFGGRDFSMTNPGRGFAVGGIFTDGGDANRYYNAPVTDQKNLANTIAYQMINNFPPVYVDVKDVNNQQNILAQTVNRVNL